MQSWKTFRYQRTPGEALRREIGSDRLSLYLSAAVVVVVAFLWRTTGLRPGIGLVSSLIPLGLLLLRWRQSLRAEKVFLFVLTALALLLEVHTARVLEKSSRTLLLCRMVSPNQVRVYLDGPDTIQAATMYVLDADAVARFMATHIDDGDAYGRLVQGVPLGRFPASPTRIFPLRPLQRSPEISHYEFIFYTSNGSWVEDLQTAMVKGHIANALRIRHVVRLQEAVTYQFRDTDFPVTHPDWAWAVDTPANFGYFGVVD